MENLNHESPCKRKKASNIYIYIYIYCLAKGVFFTKSKINLFITYSEKKFLYVSVICNIFSHCVNSSHPWASHNIIEILHITNT